MRLLQRLLPQSLVGRVFSLYVATLLLFVGVGLGLFYRYQFAQQIEDELLAGEMMVNVAAQTVGDSAVIGDYDTISKTLDRAIAQSNFSKAQFIDTNGGVLTAHNVVTPVIAPPQWLLALVQERLFDINQNIRVGGKDYGVFRLTFAAGEIAGELWRVAVYALLVGLFGAVITWRSAVGALAVRSAGETSMILGWPVWIAQILMVPGFLLLALAGFYMMVQHWRLSCTGSEVAA